MKQRIHNIIFRSSRSLKFTAAVFSLAASIALLPASDAQSNDPHSQHAAHQETAIPARLVELVRINTQQYVDVNMARNYNYQPAFGCVTGPDHGAMGIHYINGGYVGDGEIDATKPEALIYEPGRNGTMRLVGVEFIVDAATWNAKHKDGPPILEGQLFQLVNSPNRYGLPAFYELHVWAWRENPNGAFVDWNNKVSCENQ